MAPAVDAAAHPGVGLLLHDDQRALSHWCGALLVMGRLRGNAAAAAARALAKWQRALEGMVEERLWQAIDENDDVSASVLRLFEEGGVAGVASGVRPRGVRRPPG